MPALVFRLEPGQLARMRNYALGGLALTVIAVVVAELTGRGWWFAVLFGVGGLGFGTSFLSQRNAYSRFDAAGIDANIGLGLRRHAAWADVADIRPRLRGHNQGVVVTLESGKSFALGAPTHSSLLPDPAFNAKVEQIFDLWDASLPPD
jgi:hypothetical protein